jgi:MinD-like ATPase involved in chromosome partitioning or flagellar assembly
MSSDTVPRWPRIDAIVREDGSGEVTIDGAFHPISTGSLEEARVEVLRRVTENAAQVGRPVRASATGPEGLWNLIVHPDGTVVPEEDELAPPSASTPQTPPASTPGTMPGAAPDGAPGTPGPTTGPVFEGAPVVDLPPRGDSADPLGSAGTTHAAGPVSPDAPANTAGTGTDYPVDYPADPAGTPGAAGTNGDVGPDPRGPVEADPEDTVRRVVRAPESPQGPGAGSGHESDGGSPVADWVRDNATDGSGSGVAAGQPGAMPGYAPENAPSTMPDRMPGTRPDSMAGSMAPRSTGAPLSPVSGPIGAVPTAGSGGGLSAPPSGPTPVTDGDTPRSRREARESFLTHQQDEDPATRGFRGLLTRIGIRVGPSESERAERADERAVSQHWPGPRTISMVNGKGGAGKTPSTVLLAAVFAQFGGAGVVTWDNNQTRGTLGWRTEQGPHESTLLDLLPQTDRLLGPSAQAADLARYVHHQTRDRFDVLRSKPIAMANEQRIEPQDVDAIHSVLSKYYRMILIDSGNDESDPMWQRMIDLTDQLVVATTTRDDHAEAGALLLEALATRDGRSAYLAQQAVVVVSQADQKEPASELEKVADGYRSLARAVVTIPFDPAMVDGHLRYGALRTDTRRAWLAAAAAVAGGL